MAQTVRIQMRRDDAQNWADSSVVLSSGEPAFDTTNNFLKIGPSGGATWSNIENTFVPVPTRYMISNFNNGTFSPIRNNPYTIINQPITIPKSGTWHFGLNVNVFVTGEYAGENATLQLGWLYKPGGMGDYQIYSDATSIILKSLSPGNQLKFLVEITASGLDEGDVFAFGYYLYDEGTVDDIVSMSTTDAEGWLMYPNQPSATWT